MFLRSGKQVVSYVSFCVESESGHRINLLRQITEINWFEAEK